jgi:hypothetical protein
LETYKAEITPQIRMAMESLDGETDNPLTAFYPDFGSYGVGRGANLMLG